MLDIRVVEAPNGRQRIQVKRRSYNAEMFWDEWCDVEVVTEHNVLNEQRKAETTKGS